MKRNEQKIDFAKIARQLLIANQQIPLETCSTTELFDLLLSLNQFQQTKQFNAVRLALIERDDCTPFQNIWILSKSLAESIQPVLEDKVARSLTTLPVEDTLDLLASTHPNSRKPNPRSLGIFSDYEYIWKQIIGRRDKQPSFSTSALIQIAQYIGIATQISNTALCMLLERNDYPIKPLEELLARGHGGDAKEAYWWRWTIVYLLAKKPGYPIKNLIKSLDQAGHQHESCWHKDEALTLINQRLGESVHISTQDLIELREGLKTVGARELIDNVLKTRVPELLSMCV